MTDAIVIGAGISGLSAAYALHRQGLSVTVLEAGDRPGGLIRSVREGAYLTESGPHTFPSTAQAVQALCAQLDLTPLTAHPAARKRYLYMGRRLQALPSHPLDALFSPVLSWSGKLSVLKEPFRPRMAAADPSVAEFIRHRLGTEVVDALVDPLISGIYAGDVGALSMPAVFPRLWEAEQSSGSLLKGLRARPRHAGPARPRYALQSFPAGLQTLIDALVSALPKGAIRLKTRVSHVRRTETGFEIHTHRGGTLASPRLILATAAGAAADLLAGEAPEAAAALHAIPYQGLSVVHVAFPRSGLVQELDGFGFLVPRREGVPLLGAVWASALFPGRCPDDEVLLACFLGGAHHPESLSWPEAQIRAQVLDDLARVLGPLPAPSYSRVQVHPRAIPQYTLGHRERIQAAESGVERFPGLALAGNYLHGIALNECVLSGEQAARRVLAV